MWELFFDVLKNSVLITGLVMVMLLLIEYIHVYTKGRSFARLKKRPLPQIGLAALLGLIPGCIGGFAAVSLYSHGIVTFGALIAMMISTLGDEAFVLFAALPKTALLLTALLLLLAILIGWLTDTLYKSRQVPCTEEAHYTLHQEDGCAHGTDGSIWGNFMCNMITISLKRAVILTVLLAFVVAMGFGVLEHDHHEEMHLFNERWFNLLFTVVSLFTLALTVMANEHFIKEHLWDHIIKKHLLKIFLWTFGALLFIAVGMPYLNLNVWVEQNGYVVLLLAALVGLIPESGPHLVFIALFASGAAPFSVLFTNSFVQDGHTALPLLAERKGAFVRAKVIKLCVGIALGSALYVCGV